MKAFLIVCILLLVSTLLISSTPTSARALVAHKKNSYPRPKPGPSPTEPRPSPSPKCKKHKKGKCKGRR
ncbi:hypothetical protein QUC31_018995 [Theobroma cacao]